ncbi:MULTISPECIES: hypothetical protein [Streptomyces]|uniref:ATP-binding protein n=2 Tax=Streptomyces TaxID=1883 RepID=A0A939FRV5_9ACTN|nr:MULTISPECIES: hypothetical protein [Streptomyces]MBO0654880.1 ATP-binding protein [Streptomyces triculaminicus]QSY51231.1 ATP-binding protein [Streptomyces griseocarneus]
MSLPLTRRIARVALLVAAGAAPVVGAAGSASAAALPQATDLAPVSALDTTTASKTVGAASEQAGSVASGVGSKAVHTAVPAATGAVQKAGSETLPAVNKQAGKVVGSGAQALGGTVQGATKGGLPQVPLGG